MQSTGLLLSTDASGRLALTWCEVELEVGSALLVTWNLEVDLIPACALPLDVATNRAEQQTRADDRDDADGAVSEQWCAAL